MCVHHCRTFHRHTISIPALEKTSGKLWNLFQIHVLEGILNPPPLSPLLLSVPAGGRPTKGKGYGSSAFTTVRKVAKSVPMDNHGLSSQIKSLVHKPWREMRFPHRLHHKEV